MITKRIIPCLDVKNGRVVKGVNFEGLQDMADPVEMARYYNASGADELVFYDITASVEGRGLFTDILREVAQPLLDKLPENKRAALLGVLKNDPRPAYQHDPDRVYAMDFGGYRVQFQVGESMLTVIDIQK